MKISKRIIIILSILTLLLGIYINVVYNNMGNLNTEIKLRILALDVKNSFNIFIDNGFDVKTDDFVYEGTLLTELTYSTNDLKYDIDCRSSPCFILGEKPSEVMFSIYVEGEQFSVDYNDDSATYTKEFFMKLENIFSEKIDTMYKEYIDATYTEEHRNKFHYFSQYVMARWIV